MAPDITSVVALQRYVVRVVFSDGEIRDVDVEPFLGGLVVATLQDSGEFQQMRVDEQTGAVAPGPAEPISTPT